jgi:hypothetical protein
VRDPVARTRERRSLDWLAYVVPVGLAAGIGAFMMTRHLVLTGVDGYDDGAYVGGAIALARGAVPYRDFVFVAPPGVPVLLAPLAWLLGHHGTDRVMEAARIGTVAVNVVNTLLVCVLVRARGRTAVLGAGLAFASYPVGFYAFATLLLEPYLVLFCLLGAVLLFDRCEITDRVPRLVGGGVSLGLAVTMKPWAVLIVLVALVVTLPRLRRCGWILLGATVAVVAICGPFVVLAPRAFFHQVVATQLSRAGSTGGASISGRLRALAGYKSDPHAQVLLAAGWVVLAGVVIVWLVDLTRRRGWTRLDLFLVLATSGSLAAMLGAALFYPHYPYFALPFAAALAGRAVANGRALLRSVVPRRGRVRAVAAAATLTALVAALAVIVEQDGRAIAANYHAVAKAPNPLLSRLAPGACVQSDEVSILIAANRFAQGEGSCPVAVDSDATLLSAGAYHQQCAPVCAVTSRLWWAIFRRSPYVVLSAPFSWRIGWSVNFRVWFSENFGQIGPRPGAHIVGLLFERRR